MLIEFAPWPSSLITNHCLVSEKRGHRGGQRQFRVFPKIHPNFGTESSLSSVLTQAYTESMAGADNRQKGARETACEVLGLVSKMIE